MNRKQEIAANLKDTKAKIQAINSHAQLIVVTKTFPISDLEILYELGERNFGENRDQEASEKAAQLPKDVIDRKSTRLNSSHVSESRMPSSA